MSIFTDRPQKILGNIAVTSLVAGVPLGVFSTILAGVVLHSNNRSVVEWAKELGLGLLQGPFFVFIAGLILIAPILTVLRRFDYGGPFFVYAISVIFSLVLLHDNLAFGAMSMVFALFSSYVFCRYAYSGENN